MYCRLGRRVPRASVPFQFFQFLHVSPLNKSRILLRMEWSPVYHIKEWGKFNRHYGDFCSGADMVASRYMHHGQLPSVFAGETSSGSLCQSAEIAVPNRNLTETRWPRSLLKHWD